MVLKNEWMLLVWGVVLLTVIVAFVLVRLHRSGTRRPGGRRAPVAGTAALRRSPRYRGLVRRYRLLLTATLACALVVLAGSALLSARVSGTTTEEPHRVTRDIMLCLDVSGSMISVDAEVMDSFAELVDDLKGERIALTIFNSSARSVFPLTDDYAFIKEQLRQGRDALDRRDYTYAVGTLYGDGSSLIGDGLTSCLERFDQTGEERPRSVVFATDNDLRGTPIVTLHEATELATAKKIRVFALSPTGPFTESEDIEQLAREVESTGGRQYDVEDARGVDEIVSAIQEQEAKRVRASAPRLIVFDQPRALAVTALLGVLALFGLAWRLER